VERSEPSFVRKLVGLCLLALAVVGLSATQAAAVPAFAIQTGQPCSGCHVGGFGPQLTPFGRQFKINGYTIRTNDFNVPLSAMAVASYINTAKDQAPQPGYTANNNVTLDQASVFLAGGFGAHFGAFVQGTYDGVGKQWHWDNMDLRAVTTASVGGVKMVLGASLNNAPTVDDPFNTLAGWGYPYTTSSLSPAPGAGPIIGSFAQNTVGLTVYANLNSELLLETGVYQSPSATFLDDVGIDPTDPGSIRGVAPYGRIAYTKNFGSQNFEVGGFALAANLNPGGDTSTGLSDHYLDLGLDGSYQYFADNKDVVTVNVRYTNESQSLDASQALGNASNGHDTLSDIRIDASYYWRSQIGLTVGAFDTTGSPDALLYAANRTLKPDSTGVTVQLDGTPFGNGNSALGARFNLRLGLQYTAYTEFDGAGRNFDTFGANAADNNTLRIFAWVAY
jgi:hypothetical protein